LTMRTRSRRNQVTLAYSPPVTASHVNIKARTSPLRSRQPSSTSIVNSCVCLRIYTTHTIPKFFTCVLSPTSTRSSLTSLHSAASTSCWTSKTFAVDPTRRPSALAHFGSVGEKWAFLNLDVSLALCRDKGMAGQQATWFTLLTVEVAQ
jgi:hypothetical protein